MIDKNLEIDRAIAATEKTIEEQYWLKTLCENFNRSCLPYDFPFSSIGERSEYEVLEYQLPSNTLDGLNRICNHSEMKLQFVLTTALFILIKKYSNESDISIGTSIYKQPVEADFINTILILRNVIDEKVSIKELLLETRDIIIEANENQNYPIENIIKRLKISYGKDDNYPFFDIGIILENIQSNKYLDHIKCSILISLLIEDNKLTCKIKYNSKLYKEESIDNIFRLYSQILSFFLTDIDKSVKDIDFITEPERDLLINKFNYRKDQCIDKLIIDLFEEKSKEFSKKIAVKHYNEEITYADLSERVSKFSSYLESQDVKGKVVAIHLNPSIDLIVSILAVLKSGGVFLLIDTILPIERKKFMLADSMAYRIISKANDELSDFSPEKIVDPSIVISCDNVCSFQISGSDYAYVIYTSGTTGLPKGVIINHLGLVNYIKWAASVYIKGEQIDFPLFTSVSFDLTITSIFSPLITGNTIHIYYGSEPFDLLKRILLDNKINIIKLTPSHIKLLNAIASSSHPGDQNKIKRVIVGGEQLNPQDIIEFNKHFPGVKEIYNEYGPTETVVGSTVSKVNMEKICLENISIGNPIAHTQIYILDSTLKLLPVGAIGEIYIGGYGVSKGYLNKPELTHEKFIPNPYDKEGTLYKTGDLGRWHHNGTLEFLGRSDDQVKIRGFRIELREIESLLLIHKKIKEVAVIAKEQDGDVYIVAYYVSDEEIKTAELREYLSVKLPDYMIPSFYVHMASLPLTSNGKLNRKTLPNPEIKAGDDYVAPSNETEKQLANIWSEVLKIEKEQISISKNFFELGGNSLKAIILTNRIYKELGVKISLSDLFNYPTIREAGEKVSKSEKIIYNGIPKGEYRPHYPLSSAQHRMYFLHQMDKEGLKYNTPRNILLGKEYEKDKLEIAFKAIISRHDSLRTSFHMVGEEVVQIIADQVDFKLDYYKVNAEELSSVETAFVQPFVLTQAPLIRAAYVELEKGEAVLLIDLHHIITDEISEQILEKEFISLYRGEELLPLELQYKDYTLWQQEVNQQEEIKRQRKYWEELYSEEIPILDLPIDFPRPLIQSYNGARVEFVVSELATERLRTLCFQNDCTMHMVLLSLYNILLSKLTNKDDIIIGTPIAGRPYAELERMIGLFVNTLALRNYPSSEKSYLEFLLELKANTLKAYENQDYPFDDLVNQLPLSRNTSRHPIFDVMCQTVNTEKGLVKSSALINNKHCPVTVKFDLLFIAIEYEKELHVSVNYSTSLFKASTIDRFIQYFNNLVKVITINAEIKLSEVDVLSEKEKQQLLYDFNNTNAAYSKGKTIHRLFEEQVERTPDAIALVYKDQQLSYRQLNNRANQLAWCLQEKGVINETIVGLMIERSIEMIVGILGILKSGGTYVPIDKSYPEFRIHYMIEDSKMLLLLSQTRMIYANIDIFRGISLDNLICIDDPELYCNAIDNILTDRNPNAAAYVIYTSGSTGKPKGVVVEHGSLINYIQWGISQYLDSESVRMPLYTNFSFDLTLTSIFLPLLTGNTIEISREGEIVEILEDIIFSNRVDLIKATPSHLRIIGELLAERKKTRICCFIVGGELLEVELCSQIKDMHPSIKIYNEYGPTETTVGCMIYKYDKKEDIRKGVPIGVPINNTQVYILDRDQKLLPKGVLGELCISGLGLARGYLGKDELSSEKFIIHPFKNGERLYKTGDLARWLPSGNMEFFGRVDDQVKIKGYRIELSEIEEQIRANDLIKECLVTISENEIGDKFLVTYFVSESELEAIDLRSQLSIKLPEYMIPNYFVQLKKIPLTSNGKIDRKALPNPQVKAEDKYKAPSNNTEERLVAIWSKVLNIDKENISINANFFDLGGDSFKILKLNRLVNTEFKSNITVVMLFGLPTISEIAKFILHDGKSVKKIEDNIESLANEAIDNLSLFEKLNN